MSTEEQIAVILADWQAAVERIVVSAPGFSRADADRALRSAVRRFGGKPPA